MWKRHADETSLGVLRHTGEKGPETADTAHDTSACSENTAAQGSSVNSI